MAALLLCLLLLLLLAAPPTTSLAVPPPSASPRRRAFLSLLPLLPLSLPSRAPALISAPAPPPKQSAPKKVTCRTIDECEDIGRAREAATAAALPAADIQLTPDGVRYVDLSPGSGPPAAPAAALLLDYAVLKPGKRSFDGLSNEGTRIFSGEAATLDLADARLIEALRSGLVGVRAGGVRRVQVQPQLGWRLPGAMCDGGPGGSGNGGELRTDYVIVPTATVVQEEACFDRGRVPFPRDFGEARRMAQRFDQALIVEVRVEKVM
ncbi:hypothetical protein TeGR_g3355 [Tetraparma gracilis]|uniref:Peptidylprolyl isomerase n=1 Tax=Tetraparma gracilis TaxID=2962635 RepID=A0ABQ6MFJ9_9STRA|nr:hypothetical protein TeGR_g3355 [Tetraparma gracilis]